MGVQSPPPLHTRHTHDLMGLTLQHQNNQPFNMTKQIAQREGEFLPPNSGNAPTEGGSGGPTCHPQSPEDSKYSPVGVLPGTNA